MAQSFRNQIINDHFNGMYESMQQKVVHFKLVLSSIPK